MLLVFNIANAFEQLWAHKMRSMLTVLGIIIAVASTITVVSVVQGLTAYVADFLQGMGANAMWVWPERPEGSAGRSLGRVELDLGDIRAIQRQCSALDDVSPLVRRQLVPVIHGHAEASTLVEGVSPDYHSIRNYLVAVGRSFSYLDIDRAHNVCIMGREVVRTLETDDEIVGNTVRVQGRQLRVIGILKEKGGLVGNAQDDVVLIPYTVAFKMYPPSRSKMAFAASAVSEESVPEARAQVVHVLRKRHGLRREQPNDFDLLIQDEILGTYNRLRLVAILVLASIVGISLLVGGIGIMNVMLVGVSERTREIGLRKAIGARRRDIMLQFLTEAVTLSLVGGAIGIAIGTMLCILVGILPNMVEIAVPWWAAVLGFAISAATGIISGLLPAVKAALLNPIDALRHE